MPTPKKTWREKATYENVSRKINRKKNPAASYVDLARELGAPISTSRFWSNGGPAASSSFRAHIQRVMGTNKPFTGARV